MGQISPVCQVTGLDEEMDLQLLVHSEFPTVSTVPVLEKTHFLFKELFKRFNPMYCCVSVCGYVHVETSACVRQKRLLSLRS